MMKTVKLAVLLVICMIWASCTNTPKSKCGPCPLIAEIAPFINVRIVDKTTGDDLLLLPSSPYKFSDLTVTSSVDGASVTVGVDSTQKDSPFIRILCTTSQTFNLKLSALSEDNITVTAGRDPSKCCAMFAINKIVLNSTTVCNPCTFNQMITIKK